MRAQRYSWTPTHPLTHPNPTPSHPHNREQKKRQKPPEAKDLRGARAEQKHQRTTQHRSAAPRGEETTPHPAHPKARTGQEQRRRTRTTTRGHTRQKDQKHQVGLSATSAPETNTQLCTRLRGNANPKLTPSASHTHTDNDHQPSCGYRSVANHSEQGRVSGNFLTDHSLRKDCHVRWCFLSANKVFTLSQIQFGTILGIILGIIIGIYFQGLLLGAIMFLFTFSYFLSFY